MSPAKNILARSQAFCERFGLQLPILLAPMASVSPPAPYPVQRGLTGPMRTAANREHDVERMQAWAGQSAALSRALPAGQLTRELWQGAQELLNG